MFNPFGVNLSRFFFQNCFADHFFNSGGTAKEGLQSRFAEGFHALLAAVLAQLVGGHAGRDQVAELVVDRDELEDAGATAVAGVVAALAAAAVKEFLVLAELVWP